MFVQVIKGSVSDAEALKKRGEAWIEQLGPGAKGFLGSTTGVTADGTAFTIARFESAEAAHANSSREEQGAWWAETEKLYEGPVVFRDTTDVTLYEQGGSDDAGFVQIMEGTVTDRARYEEIMKSGEDQIREMRPDVIGGITCWFGDEFVEAIYFTSEAEAREGEKRMSEAGMPPEMEEMMSLSGEVAFHDLTSPVMHSPK